MKRAMESSRNDMIQAPDGVTAFGSRAEIAAGLNCAPGQALVLPSGRERARFCGRVEVTACGSRAEIAAGLNSAPG